MTIYSHLQQCYDLHNVGFIFFFAEKGSCHQSCSRPSKQAHKAHTYAEGNRYGSCTISSFIAELKKCGHSAVIHSASCNLIKLCKDWGPFNGIADLLFLNEVLVSEGEAQNIQYLHFEESRQNARKSAWSDTRWWAMVNSACRRVYNKKEIKIKVLTTLQPWTWRTFMSNQL